MKLDGHIDQRNKKSKLVERKTSFYSRQRKKQSVGEEIVGKRKEQDKTSYIG